MFIPFSIGALIIEIH